MNKQAATRWIMLAIALAFACAPSPSETPDDATGTGGVQQAVTNGVGGTAIATGGSPPSGGVSNDESTSTGTPSIEVPDSTDDDDPSGGSAGTIVPWPSDEVRSTIASFCKLDCASLENAQECSDGDNDGVLGHGEFCIDECKDYYYSIPLACEDELDDYFQCLMMNRGYFEVHCEGDKIVRQDTTSCAATQTTTQACIDVYQ